MRGNQEPIALLRSSLASLLIIFSLALALPGAQAQAQPALSAKLTETVAKPGAEPRVVSTGALYYDSQRRTREETTRLDRAGRPLDTLIIIRDPVAQRFYIVDPSTRAATEKYFREPLATDALPGEPGSPHPEGSLVIRPAGELGEQVIEGRNCYGTVYGESPFFDWQVTWWDKETGLALLQIEHRKDGKIVKRTLSEITLGEPDPELFRPPEGYTISQARAE